MILVHSSWFPLIDRNPQKYVPNIFFANEDGATGGDFMTRVLPRSPERPVKSVWACCLQATQNEGCRPSPRISAAFLGVFRPRE